MYMCKKLDICCKIEENMNNCITCNGLVLIDMVEILKNTRIGKQVILFLELNEGQLSYLSERLHETSLSTVCSDSQLRNVDLEMYI